MSVEYPLSAKDVNDPDVVEAVNDLNERLTEGGGLPSQLTVGDGSFSYQGSDFGLSVSGGGLVYTGVGGVRLFEVLPDGSMRGLSGKSLVFDL